MSAPACRVDCSCGAALWGGVLQVNTLIGDGWHAGHRLAGVKTLTPAQLATQVAREVCR